MDFGDGDGTKISQFCPAQLWHFKSISKDFVIEDFMEPRKFNFIYLIIFLVKLFMSHDKSQDGTVYCYNKVWITMHVCKFTCLIVIF